MSDKSQKPVQKERVDNGLTRRTFLGMTLAGGATLFAGGSAMILGAASSSTTTSPAISSIWQLGGDLPLNRLGFGAMRINGDRIWGWPARREDTRKVLGRAL